MRHGAAADHITYDGLGCSCYCKGGATGIYGD
jgi:hypothetical protein